MESSQQKVWKNLKGKIKATQPSQIWGGKM